VKQVEAFQQLPRDAQMSEAKKRRTL